MKKRTKTTFLEGIIDILAKIITYPVVKRAYDKIEKQSKDNPKIKQSVKDLYQKTQELKREYEKYCAENPDSEYCKKLQDLIDAEGKKK